MADQGFSHLQRVATSPYGHDEARLTYELKRVVGGV